LGNAGVACSGKGGVSSAVLHFESKQTVKSGGQKMPDNSVRLGTGKKTMGKRTRDYKNFLAEVGVKKILQPKEKKRIKTMGGE